MKHKVAHYVYIHKVPSCTVTTMVVLHGQARRRPIPDAAKDLRHVRSQVRQPCSLVNTMAVQLALILRPDSHVMIVGPK